MFANELFVFVETHKLLAQYINLSYINSTYIKSYFYFIFR